MGSTSGRVATLKDHGESYFTASKSRIVGLGVVEGDAAAGPASTPQADGPRQAYRGVERNGSIASSSGPTLDRNDSGASAPTRDVPRPRSLNTDDEDDNDVLQQQKREARRHERYVARALGGRTTPGSGALGEPGDVVASPFLVECKLTGKRALDLRLSVIEKIDAEAVEAGLTPAVALRLAALDSDVEPDWVLVPLRVLIGIDRQ